MIGVLLITDCLLPFAIRAFSWGERMEEINSLAGPTGLHIIHRALAVKRDMKALRALATRVNRDQLIN